MNERIIELARQSGLKKHPSEDREYIGDFDWREFAELIVRECISICKEKERANLYGIREVETTIKEHFGVQS